MSAVELLISLHVTFLVTDVAHRFKQANQFACAQARDDCNKCVSNFCCSVCKDIRSARQFHIRVQTLGRAPILMADSLAKHDLGADCHARHGRYQAITISGISSVTSALIPDI